jgi:hypothetical protein
MKREKSVQIPERTFVELIQYFFFDKHDNRKSIEQALNNKLEQVVRHDLYTKSKVAASQEEREKARQEYLDRVGIHKDFRY